VSVWSQNSPSPSYTKIVHPSSAQTRSHTHTHKPLPSSYSELILYTERIYKRITSHSAPRITWLICCNWCSVCRCLDPRHSIRTAACVTPSVKQDARCQNRSRREEHVVDWRHNRCIERVQSLRFGHAVHVSAVQPSAVSSLTMPRTLFK
jgi:hypothetical protein